MSQHNFQSLFRSKEFITLSGRRRKNIAILSLVTFFTFLSVGFSLGGLAFLSDKLDDPFVRQLSFQANQEVTGQPNTQTISTVKSWATDFKFDPNNVRMYGPTFNSFFDINNKELRRMRGRSISQANPVLVDLLKSKNIVWKSPREDGKLIDQMDDAQIRIIVTADLLQMHGYDPSNPPSFLRIYRQGAEPWQAPLLAVVKRLPDRSAYVLSHNAWLCLEGVPGMIESEKSDKLFLHFDALPSSNKPQLLSELKKAIISTGIGVDRYTWREKSQNTKSSFWTTRGDEILELSMVGSQHSNYELARKIQPFLSKNKGIALFEWGSKDGLRISNSVAADNYENMTVYFQKQGGLEQVPLFAEKLVNTFEKVAVDLSSIENKSSMRLFSGLAHILAIFLIAFSILSITTFVNSLISSHFQRIQRNLGTLKAFGLSKKILIRAYARISLIFVLLSTTIGFLLAMGTGLTGAMRLIIQVAGLPVANQELYFSLLNIESGVTFGVIVIVSYFFVRLNLRRLLKYTPGELIYDRV